MRDDLVAADGHANGMSPLTTQGTGLSLPQVLAACTFQPKTERILDTFAPLQQHQLRDQGQPTQTFEPELTDLQQQILVLLRLPASLLRSTAG